MTFRQATLALACPLLSLVVAGCNPPIEKDPGAGTAPAGTDATKTPPVTPNPAPADAKPETPAPSPEAKDATAPATTPAPAPEGAPAKPELEAPKS